MHLLNHIGHFPLAIGAARLCSLVAEQDDVPGLISEHLSAQVFSAPNIQVKGKAFTFIILKSNLNHVIASFNGNFCYYRIFLFYGQI